MYKKFLIVIMLIFVSACSAVAGTPTQTPSPTSTSTPFALPLRGTPLPLMYQPIAPETASSVVLLTRWKNVGLDVKQRLVFTPDSNNLVLGTSFWHVQDGSPDYSGREYRFEMNSDSPFNSDSPWKSYSPDGEFEIQDYFVSGIFIGDRISTMNWQLSYSHVKGSVGITFTPDSRYFVIVIDTGKIWFVSTKDWASKLKNGDLDDNHDLHSDQAIDIGAIPEDIAFSQDGSMMAVATKDNTVQIWDVPSLSHKLTIKNIDKSTNLAFSSDGQMIAAGLPDRQIGFWDTHSGQSITRLQGVKGVLKSIAFSPNGLLLASLDDKEGVLLWGILPRSNSPAAANTATAIAQRSFSPTSTPLPPSATPTSAIPLYTVLPWPITAPTDEQLDEVRSCDIEKIVKIRYPEALDYWQIGKAYTPQSACDWATMAVAYQNHREDKKSISEDGKRAFYQAFKLNPAFALETQIYFNYFDSLNLVSAPRIVQQPIQNLVIDYNSGVLEGPFSAGYHVKIEQANVPEKMKILVQNKLKGSERRVESSVEKKIDANLVQAVSPALVNLIPIRSPFSLYDCRDTGPDWTAQVTFLDGTVLQLSTNGSNLRIAGGPWHVQIGAKYYTQFSTDLIYAFSDLFYALGIPLGQSMMQFCTHTDRTDIFNLAYP